jgi:hypothetical protein
MKNTDKPLLNKFFLYLCIDMEMQLLLNMM